MNENAKILLTAVYDRLALSVEGETPSEDEVADLALLLTAAGQRLSKKAPPEQPRAPASDEIFPVDVAGTITMLRRSSVRYVQAQGDYARLHTTDSSYLLRVPLSQLEARWAGAGFLRIHRSFLVALPAVTEVRTTPSGCTARVGTGHNAPVLPVSRRYNRRLKDRLRATQLNRKRG